MNPEKKSLCRDDVDMVIYHHPCPDGAGSALAVKVYMKKYHPDREIIYHPTNHGREPPDVSGRNVLICDFSYKYPVLVQLIEQANSLLILDHHESAQDELREIGDQYKVFDMSHSGAYLTWKYFFPDEQVPLLIEYIQDRDIWAWTKPDLAAFVAWFYNLEIDPDLYEEYLDDQKLRHMIDTKGQSNVELQEKYIGQAVKHGRVKFVKVGYSYYLVVFINCTNLKDDVGNRLLDKFPLADFSAVYSINDGDDSTSFSLRSSDRHASVSKVAVSLGGGGHRNASGLRVRGVTNIIGRDVGIPSLYWKLNTMYFRFIKVGISWYTVVYFNSPLHKRKIGKYLLQTKYEVQTEAGETVPVQVSQAVAGHQGANVGPVHMSAVWDYDGATDMTNFAITLHPNLSEEQQTELTHWLKRDPNGDLVYQGMCKELTPFMCPLEDST